MNVRSMLKYALLLGVIYLVPQVAAADKVESEADLVSILVEMQEAFQPISPPGNAVYIAQPSVAYSVDWTGFSEETTRYATAYMDEYGLPRYALLLYEDVATRDRVITLASTGYELARIAAPDDYVPDAYYAGLLSCGSTYCEAMRWVFDPAHTAVELELVPEPLYSAYASYEGIAVEEESTEEAVKTVSSESTAALEMTASSVSTFSFDDLTPPSSGVTNTNSTAGASNVCAELTFPVPDDFGSSTGEIFQVTNLVMTAPSWEIGVYSIAVTSGVDLVWTDHSSSNIPVRFYILNDPSIDDDGDGINTGREKFLAQYGTRWDLFDTDGDGLGDGWEYDYGFDPLSDEGSNGALGDADHDGFSNLEEQTGGTDPTVSDSGGSTGTVGTIRYYYDEDDRLTDFYVGSEAAQQTLLSDAHNISEEVSVK